jgi:hypothetical protein
LPSAENGHWPDTFKKPNHPTFSVESQYATGADRALAEMKGIATDPAQREAFTDQFFKYTAFGGRGGLTVLPPDQEMRDPWSQSVHNSHAPHFFQLALT